MKKVFVSLLLLLILCACGTPFSSEQWLAEPDSRNSMVDSLINNHKLEGMTEKEIVDLLGEPAQKLDEPARQFVYYLGRAGLGVDDSLFKLHFNQNGELKSYEITHD